MSEKKKKNIEKKDLRKEIKKMEEKKRKEAEVKVIKPVQKISFDSWFHLRGNKIPKMHDKLVIWAYFKSLGLSKLEKMEDFDSAIRKYGLKV